MLAEIAAATGQDRQDRRGELKFSILATWLALGETQHETHVSEHVQCQAPQFPLSPRIAQFSMHLQGLGQSPIRFLGLDTMGKWMIQFLTTLVDPQASSKILDCFCGDSHGPRPRLRIEAGGHWFHRKLRALTPRAPLPGMPPVLDPLDIYAADRPNLLDPAVAKFPSYVLRPEQRQQYGGHHRSQDVQIVKNYRVGPPAAARGSILGPENRCGCSTTSATASRASIPPPHRWERRSGSTILTTCITLRTAVRDRGGGTASPAGFP